MTATGHAVIGTVIAAKIGNPALAIPLAIASHVVADMIPHWDTGVGRKEKGRERFFIESAIDVGAGFAISYLIIRLFFPATDLIYAFIVILASQSFDWLTAPYLFFRIKNPPFFYWSYKLQLMFDNGVTTPIGKYAQVAAVVIVVLLGIFIT